MCFVSKIQNTYTILTKKLIFENFQKNRIIRITYYVVKILYISSVFKTIVKCPKMSKNVHFIFIFCIKEI